MLRWISFMIIVMIKRIVFCHIPKTGGYSFLKWVKPSIYALNDVERRCDPLNIKQKLFQSEIIEIHGGNPRALSDILGSETEHYLSESLLISIIRNPIQQYESLCKDAYVNKAYLDLPLASRSFLNASLEGMYSQSYNDFHFDINSMFRMYESFWLNKVSSPEDQAQHKEIQNFKSNHLFSQLSSRMVNSNYLFRRNAQSSYLNSVFERDFVINSIRSPGQCILLTTELLDRAFAKLITNTKILKDFSIFSESIDLDATNVAEKLLELRVNVTKRLTSATTTLSQENAYKYLELNKLDHTVWHVASSFWQQILDR